MNLSRYGYESKEYDSVVGDTDFHFRKYKAEWVLFTFELITDTIDQGFFIVNKV